MYTFFCLATALIIIPGHVFLAVESGLFSGGHIFFNLPKSFFIEIDGALFIPLEATDTNKSFSESWNTAAHHIKTVKKKTVLRTRNAWKKFAPYKIQAKKLNFKTKKVALSDYNPKNMFSNQRIDDGLWLRQVNKLMFEPVKTQKIPTIIYEGNSQISKSLFLWISGKRKKALTQSMNL